MWKAQEKSHTSSLPSVVVGMNKKAKHNNNGPDLSTSYLPFTRRTQSGKRAGLALRGVYIPAACNRTRTCNDTAVILEQVCSATTTE